MQKRILFWGVLLFSLAMFLLTNSPADITLGWSFNTTYYVPLLGISQIYNTIVGGAAGCFGLLFIVSSLWEPWADKVEKHVTENEPEMLFILSWGAYIMAYFKWLSALISNAQALWIIELAFYAGLIVFVVIPIHYYRGRKKSGQKQQTSKKK